MKSCKDCGVSKPLTDFSVRKTGKDKRTSYCKPCHSKRNAACNRRAYKLDPEKFKKKVKESKLLSKYGLTAQDFNRMYEHQEGRCDICQCELVTPCVDHCHTANKVRGLLCQSCNKALGFVKDSPTILKAMLDYLASRSGTSNLS